jgi:single-stranded-DNA-specific exonuclease
VERIQQALDAGEHITVYGDYDADGVTSSALLTCALRTIKRPGTPLDYYIPSRLTEGCGLNIKALDQLKARGTSLIITTDCASSDVEQVAYAKTLGMDLIITDHHQPPEQLPDAYAMVNPWRPDSTYGERYLCGAGVAFKLAQALYRAYNRSTEEELSLLDLVAFGTIADIAPLLGENHTLVRLGMQQLNSTRKSGLLALIRKANLQLGRIRERDIAYGLAPRINAAGRMQHARIAFDLLTTDDDEEAYYYAEELENLNFSRQQQTEELMRSVREQAQHQVNNQVVLVRGENWHEGIIGLVAGRLAEEIKRPVLVLSEDSETKLSRGSARSQQGFNIILALRGCAPILVRYGGHAQAAGFTIENDRIEELHQHLLEWKDEVEPLVEAEVLETEATDLPGVVPEQEPASPTQRVDLIFTKMEHLNYNTYSKLRELSPFGAANLEPTFKMEGLRLVDRWTSKQNGRHLHLRLASGNTQRTGTMLRGGTQFQSLNGITHVNIIFRIDSSWTPLDDESKQDIWLKILHVEPANL